MAETRIVMHENGRFSIVRLSPPIIDRRVLPNGEVEEWERPGTIPDDFIYDPELDGYLAPGEPVEWDLDAEQAALDLEFADYDPGPGPHLLTVDMIRQWRAEREEQSESQSTPPKAKHRGKDKCYQSLFTEDELD